MEQLRIISSKRQVLNHFASIVRVYATLCIISFLYTFHSFILSISFLSVHLELKDSLGRVVVITSIDSQLQQKSRLLRVQQT